jgi:hypothetical protein
MAKDNIIQFPGIRKDLETTDITNDDWWVNLDLSDVPSDDAEVIRFMRTIHNFTTLVTNSMLDEKDYELFYHAKYSLEELMTEIEQRDFIDYSNPDGDLE